MTSKTPPDTCMCTNVLTYIQSQGTTLSGGSQNCVVVNSSLNVDQKKLFPSSSLPIVSNFHLKKVSVVVYQAITLVPGWSIVKKLQAMPIPL